MTDTLWHEERLLIGGYLVEATGGATYENTNPATEKVIGIAADASAPDVDAAVGAARQAFDETPWSTDHKFRVRCLRQLQEGLTKHAEEMRRAVVAEVGAPLSLTYGPQLDTPVN